MALCSASDTSTLESPAKLLPLSRPSSAPVSSNPLSFSVSRLLGLDDNTSQPQSVSLISSDNNLITDQREESSSKRSQQKSDSPNVDSDNPSTDFDSGRESDAGRISPNDAERPRKRKQRTTFSPIEVCELEQVFSKRPYLMPDDEDELVQKLGLTRRNVRFWFQNRRAKLRRQEKIATSYPHAGVEKQPYQFPPVSREFPFRSQEQLTHARFQRPSLLPSHAEYSPCTSEQASCPCCPIMSNRFSAANIQSPSHWNYLKYLPNPFSEPSAFKATFPRVHSVPWRNALLDGHKMPSDYETRWVEGIKEQQHKD